MLLDFEVAHCSRRCAASGRALAAGEHYFSTLHMEQGAPVRRDFAADDLRSDVPNWEHPRVPFYVQSLPHRDGTDGFFVARLRKAA